MKLNTHRHRTHALALAGSALLPPPPSARFKDDLTGAVVTQSRQSGPGVYSIFEAPGAGGTAAPATFDYVYNFTLDAASNLNLSGNTYVGPTVSYGLRRFHAVQGHVRTAPAAPP